MSNSPAKVKQAELTRYMKAMVKAGVPVGELRISPDGSVRLILASGEVKDTDNPCDRLLDT
ncbi:hypothetical protein RXV90_22210 [Rhodophyticola sp. MJ-SS7]|nr:hypothetical protein [Rhodophyticola sp. MJ-SS7]